MSRFVFTCLLVVFTASSAAAHPLPNFRYDRKIEIRLNSAHVEVRYTLQLSFWTLVTDNRKLFTAEEIEEMGGKLREESRRYCEKMAPILAENLEAKVGGKHLLFHPAKLTIEQDRDHASFRFIFQAPWKPTGGDIENEFTFIERNFENQIGAVWLTIDADEKAFNVKYYLEPEDLRGKQPADYKPGDADRARRASAAFLAPGFPPASSIEPSVPEAPPASVDVEITEPDRDESIITGVLGRGPKALFDTNYGTGVLLILAAIFGAFHAFAPGHGKSVAAAFLVGEQGTFKQAALLGISTTFAHTGSVILIAAIFFFHYRDAVPQDAQHWLGLIGGILVMFVGMWLFMRRIRGKVDHVHLLGGCADMCGNHTAKPLIPQCRRPPCHASPVVETLQLRLVQQPNPLHWIRVVLLGIGAGAIPCVDAVLLLMLAVSAGKLAYALPLLVAFSVGLSTVLILIGALVVTLHRAGRRVSGDRSWFRLLPTASAVLLMGMGLWMARDAWKGFIQVG